MTRIPTVAAVAATVLLSACSPKVSTPEPDRPSAATTAPAAASTTPTSATTPAAPAAPSAHGGLSDCLKSHGITDSGGTAILLGPPAGVDPGSWDSAMKECSALAPGPGPG